MELQLKECSCCKRNYKCLQNDFGEWKVYYIDKDMFILQAQKKIKINDFGVWFTCDCGNTLLWNYDILKKEVDYEKKNNYSSCDIS